MSEYRHIANLSGPAGPRGSSEPVVIDETDDIQSLEPDVYRVYSNSAAEQLGLPGGRLGVLEVLRTSTNGKTLRFTTNFGGVASPPEIWTRGTTLSGDWDVDWRQVYPDPSRRPAYERIRDLAERDGWLAVFDPTDPSATDSSGGVVLRVRDGLGNLPDATAASGYEPPVAAGEYGQLDGIAPSEGTRLRSIFDRTVSQPLTVVTVARNTSTEPGQRFLFDGIGSSARCAVMTHSNPGNPFSIYAGHVIRGDEPSDTAPHIFSAVFSGTESLLRVDGQHSRYGLTDDSTHGLSGLTIGADTSSNRGWEGTIGPVLIFEGIPDAAALARMESLLMSTTGITRAAPKFDERTRIFSVSGTGKTTVVHGDPDQISRHGIASMTKVMTALVARENIADIDATIQVEEQDEWLSSDALRPGDVVSFRDLFYAAALPSWNVACNLLARGAGEQMLGGDAGSGEGYDRFIREMNLLAVGRGWSTASFHQPGGGGKMSARNVAELMREAMQDDFLREVFGAENYTVRVGGADSRNIDVTHTIAGNAPAAIPGFVAGKTGTSNGFGHVVVTWDHPDGTEHTTVVMETDSDDSDARYAELSKAMVASWSGGISVTSGGFSPGDTQMTTGLRDVSSLFEERSQGRVSLVRTGTTVTLTFAAVRIPSGTYSDVLPAGFRPPDHVYSEVTLGERPSSSSAQVQVTTGGSVTLYGDTANNTLRGSITWQVTSLGFPEAPYPGVRS